MKMIYLSNVGKDENLKKNEMNLHKIIYIHRYKRDISTLVYPFFEHLSSNI